MLYHTEDRRHTQNIQINKVSGENEKCVFYFMEKNCTDFLANPILMSIPFGNEQLIMLQMTTLAQNL